MSRLFLNNFVDKKQIMIRIIALFLSLAFVGNLVAQRALSLAAQKSAEEEIFSAINKLRENKGLPLLQQTTGLTTAARFHAKDMAQNNYFASNTMRKNKFGGWFIKEESEDRINRFLEEEVELYAETIASGELEPSRVIEELMKYEAYRRDFLNPDATYLGVSVACNPESDFGCYWAFCFGRATFGASNAEQAKDTNGKKAETPVKKITMDEEVLQLVNQVRSKKGLQVLELNPLLNKAAFAHAKDMADNDYFDHNSKAKKKNGRFVKVATPFERMERFTENQITAYSENIAAGQRTAEEVVNVWMKSPTHRRNILSKEVKYMGLGVAQNKESTYNVYWVQCFGF
jgi:uncharacterized protein YkwD